MSTYSPIINRRTTLTWLSAALAATALTGKTRVIADDDHSVGYGVDPDLNDPNVPWHKTLSAHQLATVAAIADQILPAEGEYPAPSTLGIPDFIDEWVSAPYPEQRATGIRRNCVRRTSGLPFRGYI